ncbi:hypothetical protein JXC34_00125 [Candidatus Woesearchaeota archaeon]|nr:hypothetical protein [Candidatus Woesearchaeota archaeon]
MKKLSAAILVFIFVISSSSSFSEGFFDTRQVYYSEYNPDLIPKFIDVPVIATDPGLNAGILGMLRIGLIGEGQGRIIFDSRTTIDFSTAESIANAIDFAERYTGISGFDYFISYDLNSESVSGGSTGAAAGLGMIALLTNNTFSDEPWIITGAIDSEGNLLETGGIPLKVISAGNLGIKTMYIPANQSSAFIYEEHKTGQGSYFIAKNIDLKEYAGAGFNMTLSEVENLAEITSEILKRKD